MTVSQQINKAKKPGRLFQSFKIRGSALPLYIKFVAYQILTIPFTILRPPDQEIGEFYVVQKSCKTDSEAPKL